MRILFVSHARLKKELGAAKVVIELAEEMEPLGWKCDFLSLAELAPDGQGKANERYSEVLRACLRERAGEYDVVDYDHGCLPFPRSEFPAKTLLVARSILLGHHFMELEIPGDRDWRSRARAWLLRRHEAARKNAIFARARATIAEADLVNVTNDRDRAALVRDGVPDDKIIVVPYGMSGARQKLFDALPDVRPNEPIVAFVGTFDNRKGSTDFPAIVRDVVRAVPEASFRLLGTFRSEPDVRDAFPKALRHKVNVIPEYAPDALPGLLSPCAVGVFPSYIESFGFGVLEMLAAGLPVVAYDAPGPPVMLPADYLVRPGDTAAMSGRVAALLQNRSELSRARSWAKQRARVFSWVSSARQTSDVYTERWRRRQGTGAA